MTSATSELDALLTAVMNSLRQPQEKATQWNAALAASLVTQKSQLAELLSTERKEKKAGNGGCEGWRTVLSALDAAGIVHQARPVVEAKLVALLDDEFPDGPAAPSPPGSSGGTPLDGTVAHVL